MKNNLEHFLPGYEHKDWCLTGNVPGRIIHNTEMACICGAFYKRQARQEILKALKSKCILVEDIKIEELETVICNASEGCENCVSVDKDCPIAHAVIAYLKSLSSGGGEG